MHIHKYKYASNILLFIREDQNRISTGSAAVVPQLGVSFSAYGVAGDC
jgi:hypothetical protein